MPDLPPNDVNAEASLLASLVLCDGDEECWSQVVACVRSGTFALKDNGIVFDALQRLRQAGERVDALTLRAELVRSGKWEGIGGMPFFASLINSVPSWHNWKSYLGIVVDTYRRRQMIGLAESLMAKAHLPPRDMDSLEIAAEAQRVLAGIVESGTGARYVAVGELVAGAFERIGSGEVSYVPSSFDALDRIIGGFGHSEFWTIGARPSMGKSTICRQLAVRIAKSGIPVGFISLEESLAKMSRNLLAAESGIENNKIRMGTPAQEEWTELAGGVSRLSNVPLFFTDSARRLADIRAMAAMMQAREKIQILFIDYLQRIRGTRTFERFEAVTEISMELSDLAKTSKLAVVCPVQLNRALEGREEKRPTMADIRESGQIEQDADGIIFLHREDYYRQQKRDPNRDGIAELIIAKNRDGIRGVTVRLRSDLKHQRFDDYVPEHPGEAA